MCRTIMIIFVKIKNRMIDPLISMGCRIKAQEATSKLKFRRNELHQGRLSESVIL